MSAAPSVQYMYTRDDVAMLGSSIHEGKTHFLRHTFGQKNLFGLKMKTRSGDNDVSSAFFFETCLSINKFESEFFIKVYEMERFKLWGEI